MKKIIFRTIALCLLAGSFATCSDEKDGACGAGEFSSHFYRHTDMPGFATLTFPLDKTFYYSHAISGRVQFYIGETVVNICPDEHMKVSYDVLTKDVAQPLPLKIFGEAFWSVFTDELILINDNVTQYKNYTGTMEVGLKQAFPDMPGEVDVYLTVEFDTQGSFSADSAYFVEHISYLSIISSGSYFL